MNVWIGNTSTCGNEASFCTLEYSTGGGNLVRCTIYGREVKLNVTILSIQQDVKMKTESDCVISRMITKHVRQGVMSMRTHQVLMWQVAGGVT